MHYHIGVVALVKKDGLDNINQQPIAYTQFLKINSIYKGEIVCFYFQPILCHLTVSEISLTKYAM